MLIRFFLIIVLVLSSSEESNETLEWNEAKKLSWADFKGPIDSNSDAAAVTASGITFSYTIQKTGGRISDFKSQVFAYFYTKESYHIKERCNDYILAHEQLHFDITELHARMFRYQLSRLQMSQSLKTQIDQLHKTINTELSEIQQQYDRESQNSVNAEAQAKWTAHVAENLKKFESFKSN